MNRQQQQAAWEVTTWEDQAACRDPQVDPSWFDEAIDMSDDTVRESKADRALRYAKAKAVCGRCPVIRQCDANADQRGGSGIWSGRLLREMTGMRPTQRARAAHRMLQERLAETAVMAGGVS